MSLGLSPEEQKYLTTYVYPDLTEHARDINYLIRMWILFVNEVEEGYWCSLCDYESDLLHRLIIQEILDGGPASLQEKVLAAVARWTSDFVMQAGKQIDH